MTRHTIREAIRNAPYRIFGASDGLPIPPKELRSLIWGPNADLHTFFKGQDNANRIRNLLSRLVQCGANLDQFRAVLDFGCGCGRDIRQFHGLSHLLKNARIYGTDINEDQVKWCSRNLTFATFSVNGPEPPLPYPDDTFDLIYNYSVFTHLHEAQQHAWMRELERILKPGGFLLLSVSGESYLHELNDSETERFKTGQLVVRYPELSGSPADYGLCAAYHPVTYVQQRLAPRLEILDMTQGRKAVPGSMDEYVLRKRVP